MFEKELVISILRKIEFAIDRILSHSDEIHSPEYYYTIPAGMERLESTCMLLITMGESIKNIDKNTNKELLSKYPGINWKGIMGMRDVIAHHYFDLDAEIVFEVVKQELPGLKITITRMISDLEALEQRS